MVCKTLPVLSKTTQSQVPPPPPTPGGRGALVSAAVFPTLGGLAIGMWLENIGAGVAGYYALLALALLSPEGAGLRNSFNRRLIGAQPTVALETPPTSDADEPSPLAA